MDIEYTVFNRQRVIIGMSPLETDEFERIDAQIPLNAKPVWPDTANSPVEERWLELYTKHQHAKLSPHRRFGGVRSRVAA
jgi:hypothetical protein